MATDGNLTTLLSSGIDAFNNLWDVLITFPTNVSNSSFGLALVGSTGNMAPYSVRANDFTPPELDVATYTVNYKGVELSRPNAKFNGAREFDLQFRMDASYNLLQDLLAWKHLFFDPSGEGNIEFGALSADNVTTDTKNYGMIQVIGYDSSTELGNMTDLSNITEQNIAAVVYTYMDVVCMRAGTPPWQRSGSDAATVSAHFIFGRTIEPYSNNGGVLQTPSSGIAPSTDYTPTLGYA